MNKKGIFFTFMCFLLVLLIVIIFAYQRNITLQYKQPVTQNRQMALNELYKSLDEALLPDALRVASIQALLVATEKIKETKTYFSLTTSTPSRFERIVMGVEYSTEMQQKTIGYWLEEIKNAAEKTYHAEISLDFTGIVIRQNGPWFVNVTGNGTIIIKDEPNNMQWKTMKNYTVTIPITGMPDPLWAGQGVSINITNMVTVPPATNTNMTYEIPWMILSNDGRINTIKAAIQQHAFFHPIKGSGLEAPNYLQRFKDGKDSDEDSGIFALADMELQNAITGKRTGNDAFKFSYIDYKFIKPVTSTPLYYLIGPSDIDGILKEWIPMPSPGRFIDHEFHIPSLLTELSFKRGNEKYRFKLDDKDITYLGFANNMYCKDEVNDKITLPIFTQDNNQCYLHAVRLKPSGKATVS